MSTKKEVKLNLILETAARLFREKGYNATSMRDLADQVGLDAASMYHYIRSKEEILKTICFKVGNTFISQLNQVEETAGNYPDKLKDLVRLHVRLMVTQGAEVSVANNDWKALSGDDLVAYKKLRNTYEERLGRLIRKGIQEGSLKNVHPAVALFTLLSALRWVEFWWRPDREIDPEELEGSIMTILFKGLELEQYEQVS